MSKEAMKLALEALEVATTPLARDRQEVLRAQAALREALAEQPAQHQCKFPMCHNEEYQQALAEQIERELVGEQPAQQECRTDGRCQYAIDSGAEGMGHCPKGKCIMPVHQEPVAVVSGYYGGQCVILPIDPARIFNSNTALYTSPPASKPLTDEEILSLVPGLQDCLCDPWDYNNSGDYYASIPKDMIRLARAIEAAHGIKGDA